MARRKINCPRCGTPNVYPRSLWFRGECRLCEHALPRRWRVHFWTSDGLLLLLALGAAGTVAAVVLHEAKAPPAPAGSSLADTAPALRPVPIRPGFILTSGRAAEALFEIKAPPGENYYVKLVHLATRSTWVTIYVEGGKSFTGQVPLGEFELRWAMGQTWYGLHALFGPETRYERAIAPLRFEKTAAGIIGMTVELTRSADGNLLTAPAAADDF